MVSRHASLLSGSVPRARWASVESGGVGAGKLGAVPVGAGSLGAGAVGAGAASLGVEALGSLEAGGCSGFVGGAVAQPANMKRPAHKWRAIQIPSRWFIYIPRQNRFGR